MPNLDIAGTFGLKGFNFGLGTVGNAMVWVFISFIVFAFIIAVVVYIIYKKTYNQKILIFGLMGNVPTLKESDLAKIVRIGAVGDTLFYIQRKKKYITPPTIQMAKRVWWFWERSDGELINFGLENVDELFRKAGIYYIDTDMRMQRLGIEKNLRDRFEKVSFWQKYGSAIMGALFVIMVTVALVVLFAKLVDVSKALEKTAQSIQSMADSVDKYYKKTSGQDIDTGLTPAFALLFTFANYKSLLRRCKKWRV